MAKVKKKIHVRNRLHDDTNTWCGKRVANVERFIDSTTDIKDTDFRPDFCGQCELRIVEWANRYEAKWFLNNETT